MGRTTQTITLFLDQAEHGVFGRFIQACTPQERLRVRRLFAGARRHIAAINMSGHMLPFETTLLAMMVEQQRDLDEARSAIEKLLEP